ncbi:MAG TPA: hypothetical protein VM238_10540 [Phycisphaerae bacterium]|nr:hypothetical protein [Phycisphaerae bacterium]
MAHERDIRDVFQRSPLADADEASPWIHGEPALPPMQPRRAGIARVDVNHGGGRYRVTQQTGDGNQGLQDVTEAEGFVGYDAREVWGRDTAAVGDYVLYDWIREPSGGRTLWIMILRESEDAMDGELKEFSISGIKGCRSIVVSRLGKVIGGYTKSGVWVGVHDHDEPAATTLVDLGEP